MTKGSTSKEPTTVKFVNPVFVGLAVWVKLYWPELILLEPLRVAFIGVNAVLSEPPTPSFKVNGLEPTAVKLIGLELVPAVPT